MPSISHRTLRKGVPFPAIIPQGYRKFTKALAAVLAVVALIGGRAHAQSADSLQLLRPVSSAYMLEYGSAHIADTYLTPLHYRGWQSALSYERSQAMAFDPSRWTQQLELRGILGHTENPAHNATILSGWAQGSWHMTRRYALPCGFSAGVGAGASAKAGVLYLSRNGNNPASARAAVTIDAAAFAAWRGHIGRLPLTVRYQGRLPLIGVFFSPDYGQLYYQIYLGDDKGLAHAAWWPSYFSYDHLLCADIHLGNTSLRVGYRGSFLSTKTNNLVTRDVSHSLVLGVTLDWITVSPTSSALRQARIIQSY